MFFFWFLKASRIYCLKLGFIRTINWNNYYDLYDSNVWKEKKESPFCFYVYFICWIAKDVYTVKCTVNIGNYFTIYEGKTKYQAR